VNENKTPAPPAAATTAARPLPERIENVIALGNHALIVLRDPTPDDAGAYLVPVPDALFWQKTRPHVLRVVSERPSARPLLFIVRPEHADADRAALDAVLEKQGGPVPHVLRAGKGGKPFTEWRLFPDHEATVELIATTPRA